MRESVLKESLWARQHSALNWHRSKLHSSPPLVVVVVLAINEFYGAIALTEMLSSIDEQTWDDRLEKRH
jgi:hypothetical protein